MNNLSKPYKKLWRSRKERKIAGICGGLADYFHIDPFWFRLAFVVLLLLGGSALPVYLLMWILIPLEPDWRDA